VAFLNWRFELTQLTLWRIEVAPVPDLLNVATPQNLSSPSQSLYMDMGMVMMPKKGVRGMCNEREHGEHKRDKERCRCEARSAYLFPNVFRCSCRTPHPALS
jgi:hypothetical protein